MQVTGTDNGKPQIRFGLESLAQVLADENDRYDLQPAEQEELYEVCHEVYTEHFPDTVEKHFADYKISKPSYTQIRCFAQIDSEKIEWLWHPYLPIGKPCELIGDPSVGKSYLCVSIIKHLTKGDPLPFDKVVNRQGINCLYISAEDGAEDTLKPRLDQAGADMNRVYVLDGFDLGSGDELLNLKMSSHRGLLERAIKKYKIGFLVIDPIDAFLGGADANSNSQIRGLLSPLNKILQDTRCTLLVVRHLNKDSKQKVQHRGNGSVGFTANSRSSFVVGRVGDEDSEERAMMCIKANLSAMPDSVGFTINGAGVSWSSKRPDIQLGDLLSPDTTSEEVSDKADTKAWLLTRLEDGPVPSKELYADAKEDLDVSPRTLKRAKKALNQNELLVIASKEKGWCWERTDVDNSRGSNSSDSTTDSENDTLEETQSDQGDSAPETSITAQGGQPLESDTLEPEDDLHVEGLPF